MEEGFTLLLDTVKETIDYQIAVIRYGHNLNYYRQLLETGQPPKTVANGDPYVVPTRGMLLGNLDPEFVKSFYIEERPFMLCFLLMTGFEGFGDFNLAKKWAYRSLSSAKKLPINIFHNIANYCLAYLIADRKFDEAIRWQLELIKQTNEFDVTELNRLEGIKELTALRSTMIKSKGLNFDEILIEITITLIILKNLIDILDSEQNEKAVWKNTLEVLVRWKEVFKEQSAIVYIIEFVRQFTLEDDPDLQIIYQQTQDYAGLSETGVKTIGYLLLSMKSDSISALRQHSAFIARLEPIMLVGSPGGHQFLLTVFLEKFWIGRMGKDTKAFRNPDFMLSNGLDFYRKGKMKERIKRLFKILYNHTDVPSSMQFDEWMN